MAPTHSKLAEEYELIVDPERCCVCYRSFCTECADCEKGRCELDCQCPAESMCNECWYRLVATAQVCDCPNPDCPDRNRLVWRCPVCRDKFTTGGEFYAFTVWFAGSTFSEGQFR